MHFMQKKKKRGVTNELQIDVNAYHCINNAAHHTQKEESLFCDIKHRYLRHHHLNL